MKRLLPAGLAAILFISCGSKAEEEYVSPTATTAPATDSAAQKKESPALEQLLGPNRQAPQPIQVNTSQPAAQPITANMVPATAQPVPVAAAPTTTAAGLNPAHGQPGHRCEIAVGAPLSSAPAAAPATQPQPITVKQNAPSIIPTTVKAVPAAAGMNPQHGQPGHRCDIAVGAPLNSKPAAATPAAAKSQPAQPVPAIAQQPAPVAPTAPGMNPAHGQPGHRCDIGVGAPLNSAPAKKDSSR
jgi:hypothetical protein